MKRGLIRIGIGIICLFALVGFILVIGYAAIELGWTKTRGVIDTQHDYFKNQTVGTSTTDSLDTTSENWAQGEEWDTLKTAITKDKKIIEKVSLITGVPARVIVAPLVVEQLRLFYSEREIFKQAFAPLKILGVQSQFSWGVMGIKQDTARRIEDNLKPVDPLTTATNPWYLGSIYEHLLDFQATTTDKNSPPDNDTQRFNRLTDGHNRYYSYLYGALMIKELEAQWRQADFPIETRPDIIATLFNIGFQNSHPHANAQIGGAAIDIGSTTYSFGGLAGSFYVSNELIDIFPR